MGLAASPLNKDKCLLKNNNDKNELESKQCKQIRYLPQRTTFV